MQLQNADEASSSSLCPMINRRDNQWRCILPFITNTWAEEGEDPLREQTPSEGVDVRAGLHVKERHSPPFVIRKHSDSLRLILEGKKDRGGVQSTILVPAPQPHGPVAVLRLGGDHPLPVYRLFDHAQVPEGLCAHCNLIEDAREYDKLNMETTLYEEFI